MVCGHTPSLIAGGAGLSTKALLGAEGIACLFSVTTAELKVNLNLDP